MQTTSAKKIISLQIENANYSRDLGVIKDRYALLSIENNNLKLEIDKLKQELASLTKPVEPVKEVLTPSTLSTGLLDSDIVVVEDELTKKEIKTFKKSK